MAVYCNQCGTVLPHGVRFCSKCGAGIPAAVYGAPMKRLVRPHMGRQVAGVCIGLSQTYGWDLGLVRVLTVLGTLFSSGLIGVAYLACWIGIPEEPIDVPGVYPPHA
jgi:phage shock protein PspC (stress-responsive transcriptional regulator)